MFTNRFVRCIAVLCLLFCWIVPREARSQGAEYRVVDAFGELEFIDPIGIITAPGDSNRVFVLERRGVISVVTNVAIPTRTVFMDIDARVQSGSGNSEEGLLGMAFHPGYRTNRYFYLFYTTTGTRYDRLARYLVSESNPDEGDPGSELVLIDQLDQASNHNGGDLHFGADGYLFVSLGDEGGANDNNNNSQLIDRDFFSGILRIDVDERAENLVPNTHAASIGGYRVPADNPFVGATSFNGLPVTPSSVRTEFWAVGLRNPWRMSFDRETGVLYCADVGQGLREEIDIIVKGGNYGWNYREGFIAGPESPTAGFVGIEPIHDYPHSGFATNSGRSVTGGVVYRGDQIPDLYGDYVFADYVSGNVWALHYDGASASEFRHLVTHPSITAFGVDPSNGDVLMANLSEDRIKRLVYVEPSALSVEIVSAGSVWKYLDDGSNQGDAWQELGFNDGGWGQGAAELGNGDGGETTLVNLGPGDGRFRTLYFRHLFNVPDPGRYASLTVGVLRDDGAVVHLNGEEVFRSNMGSGPVDWQTLAENGISGPDESTFYTGPVDVGRLVAGDNILAVEVHQSSMASSDLSFDLFLSGEVLPELAIDKDGGDVVVSWPAPAPGYALQDTPAFQPAGWSVVGESTVRQGDRNRVRVAPDGPGGRHYRLARIDPLRILKLPTSVSVPAGTNVSFSITAVGTARLSYQWSLNGTEITGATGPSIDLVDVQLEDAGDYTVEIVDAAEQRATVGASLVVLVPPTILVQPQSQTVNAGEDVTFSVTAAGTVPMGYRWRRGGLTVKQEVTSSLTSSVTLSNVPLNLDGSVISVVLTNAAFYLPGVLSDQVILHVNP